MNIGTFAVQTGLSIPMLRYYHEIGVLEPASVETQGSFLVEGRRAWPTSDRIL